MDLNEIERKTSQSQNDLTELKAALRHLVARVDRQAVVIQALKDMVLATTENGEDVFLERLSQAVAQKADDKSCRKCGKAMNPKQNRCMYCGEARPAELV
jgi:hypothetical protein